MQAPASRTVFACIALTVSGGTPACGDAGGQEWLPPLQPTVREQVSLMPCDVPFGGYDVLVSALTCEEAADILDRLGRGGPLAAIKESVVFDRGNGWTCWADLPSRFGPIQNVCWRGSRVIVYKVA